MKSLILKDKAEIRKAVLTIRDRIPQEVRALKDREIMERLFNYRTFLEAEVVVLYASFRSEVNTFPLIEYALKEGKRVLLPRVNKEHKRLDLYFINSTDDLIPGYMGILEPNPERSSVAEGVSLDLIILPGVAFDLKGGRIGYGGGYYDRLIASLQNNPILVAIAYEEQIMDETIPLSSHDRRVDTIITDRRIIEVRDGH